MAEDLSLQCAHLRITEEEEDVVDISSIETPASENKVALALVGRVLSSRSVNFMAMKNTLNQIWALSKKAIFREVENNMFVIVFANGKDREKVLNGRPWTFDNHLVLLDEMDGSLQPENVNLFFSPFWVRIYNLPFDSRTDADIKAIVGRLGDVLEIEEDAIGFDRSRRARVMLDVRKPLRRMQKIRNKKGVVCSVEFKYERLPFFCYFCGMLCHTERDCSLVTEEEKDVGRPWGAWLKASPRKGRAIIQEETRQFVNAKKSLSFHNEPRSHALAVSIAPTSLGVDVRSELKDSLSKKGCEEIGPTDLSLNSLKVKEVEEARREEEVVIPSGVGEAPLVCKDSNAVVQLPVIESCIFSIGGGQTGGNKKHRRFKRIGPSINTCVVKGNEGVCEQGVSQGEPVVDIREGVSLGDSDGGNSGKRKDCMEVDGDEFLGGMEGGKRIKASYGSLEVADVGGNQHREQK